MVMTSYSLFHWLFMLIVLAVPLAIIIGLIIWLNKRDKQRRKS